MPTAAHTPAPSDPAPPAPPGAVIPPVSSSPAPHLGLRFCLYTFLLLAGAAACFAADRWALHWIRDRFYEQPEYASLGDLIHFSRRFSEWSGVTAILLLVWLGERLARRRRADAAPRRNRALAILLAVLLAALSAQALKTAFGRGRPNQTARATVFRGPAGGLKGARWHSYPSAHAAAAFALATGLAWFYRRLAVPVFLLAAVCGFSRICSEQHFLSDVYAGAALGVLLALWALRTELLERALLRPRAQTGDPLPSAAQDSPRGP